MFIRVAEATIQDNAIALNTDPNYNLDQQPYVLAFEANISGSATTAEGANALIETQQFAKRRFAHGCDKRFN